MNGGVFILCSEPVTELPAVAAWASAPAVATTAAVFAGLGFVDVERASVEFLAVEGIDGFGGAFIIHGHESKAAWAAGFAISDHGNFRDFAKLAKGVLNTVRGGVEGKVSYVDLHRLLREKREVRRVSWFSELKLES